MSPFIRRPSVRHTDRVLARSVLFLVLAVYVVTAGGLPDNPDGELEFQTTSAFARTGELAIGGTPEAEASMTTRGTPSNNDGRTNTFISANRLGSSSLGCFPKKRQCSSIP